jgi:hypothetical protein
MGPAESVRAHKDLDAQQSIAAHFRVFQLGPDGFDDAVNRLASVLKESNIDVGAFLAPTPGQVLELMGQYAGAVSAPGTAASILHQ